ncbi:MAG: sigma-54-dependent Fis family transcriptional regulator [Ignavibacteriae bacterium]|nr:sigma-54-dependent Fis family transcriptional regulator [Ignavibacteriota bacterium]
MNDRILVVDDERGIREMLRMTLEYEGFTVHEADTGAGALEALGGAQFDAVLLDVKMPGLDGMETLAKIRERDDAVPVIILTGHGSIETAVEATRRGAFDFLSKPPDREKILITLRNALTQTQLLRENQRMRREIEGTDDIIGTSKAITDLMSTVERVAPAEAFVLITGENGSGKELIARAVHRRSARAGKPLVEVNCAAIPSELIESELFGHEKGSFTGATNQRIGKFEQAHTGTILLDEIGDMSLAAQAKVLRVLEEGTFERVGGNRLITVDVRVIAATNKVLQTEIKEGRFREDLFHRLNVIPLHVPPLRERREDIPLLIAHFLQDAAKRNKLPVRPVDREAVSALREMHWPGNVRELRNAVERLAILVAGPITLADVQRFVEGSSDAIDALFSAEMTFQEFKDKAEALFLGAQLERFQWNVSRTADELDIQRSHLYTKIKKYGLMRDVPED